MKKMKDTQKLLMKTKTDAVFLCVFKHFFCMNGNKTISGGIVGLCCIYIRAINVLFCSGLKMLLRIMK